MRFVGQLADDDLSVGPGGCQHGGGRCVKPAELELEVPAISARRKACREHAVLWLFAVAGEVASTTVLVRHREVLAQSA
jgi:hypothetical protein